MSTLHTRLEQLEKDLRNRGHHYAADRIVALLLDQERAPTPVCPECNARRESVATLTRHE